MVKRVDRSPALEGRAREAGATQRAGYLAPTLGRTLSVEEQRTPCLANVLAVHQAVDELVRDKDVRSRGVLHNERHGA